MCLMRWQDLFSVPVNKTLHFDYSFLCILYILILFLTAPSASPETVSHTSRTNTSLTFEWSRVPCGQRGGPNDFYYQLSVDGSLIYNDSTPDLSATIVGLDSCNSYSFVAMAFNDAGDGDHSEPIKGETGIGGKR